MENTKRTYREGIDYGWGQMLAQPVNRIGVLKKITLQLINIVKTVWNIFIVLKKNLIFSQIPIEYNSLA